MDRIQTGQNLFGPIQDLDEIGRRFAVAASLRQPLTEVALHPFQHQHRLSVQLAVIEQGDDVLGLRGRQTGQELDFPLQMRAPVPVKAAVRLRHRLGVDEL